MSSDFHRHLVRAAAFKALFAGVSRVITEESGAEPHPLAIPHLELHEAKRRTFYGPKARAQDTSDQIGLDFSAPPPRTPLPIDPEDIYEVLPRSEHRRFEMPIKNHLKNDHFDSETVNGSNTEFEIVGILQNVMDGKIIYTVIYIWVHAEALGYSTYKKRATTGRIDARWNLSTAHFVDSRGKLMSLDRQDANSLRYEKIRREAARKLRRPFFRVFETYSMKNPEPIPAPDSSKAMRWQPPEIQARRTNAEIALGRTLGAYPRYRRYYRLEELPSVEWVKNRGIALWNEVARKIGDPPYVEQPITADLLPQKREDWPFDPDLLAQADSGDEYYDTPRYEHRHHDASSSLLEASGQAAQTGLYKPIARGMWRRFERPLRFYFRNRFARISSMQLDDTRWRVVAAFRSQIQSTTYYSIVVVWLNDPQLSDPTSPAPDDQGFYIETIHFYEDGQGAIKDVASVLASQGGAPGTPAKVQPKQGTRTRNVVQPPLNIVDFVDLSDPTTPRMSTPSWIMPDLRKDHAKRTSARRRNSLLSAIRTFGLRMRKPKMIYQIGLDLYQQAQQEIGVAFPQIDPASLVQPERSRERELGYAMEGVEHMYSKHATSPFLDHRTERLIERRLTQELVAYESQVIKRALSCAPHLVPRRRLGNQLGKSQSIGSLAYQIAHELPQYVEELADAAPMILDLSPARDNPGLAMVLVLYFDQDIEQTQIASYLYGAGLASEPFVQMALPALPADPQDILRHYRAQADTTMTTMDLMRGIRRYNQSGPHTRVATPFLEAYHQELDEAIRIADTGEVELDYDADRSRSRKRGDFRTKMNRTAKNKGRRVKGYKRTLRIYPDPPNDRPELNKIEVVAAYSRTKDLPMDLLQAIKAGSFQGSDQFVKRTALYLAAILREKGIKPDYLIPLPSRAGFPLRLANALTNYVSGARMLQPPPKTASVGDTYIAKRRKKARDYYNADVYKLPSRARGTFLIIDDWFVTGSSIAAVAELLVRAQDSEQIGTIDNIYGLVLGVSSGSGGPRLKTKVGQARDFDDDDLLP
jgi:hypothetical protein